MSVTNPPIPKDGERCPVCKRGRIESITQDCNQCSSCKSVWTRDSEDEQDGGTDEGAREVAEGTGESPEETKSTNSSERARTEDNYYWDKQQRIALWPMYLLACVVFAPILLPIIHTANASTDMKIGMVTASLCGLTLYAIVIFGPARIAIAVMFALTVMAILTMFITQLVITHKSEKGDIDV